MNQQSFKTLRNRILAALGAIVILIFALLAFMQANQNRIVEQNTSYLEDITRQTARRLDDVLNNALSSVRVMAQVYQDALISPNINTADASTLVDIGNFDAVFFTLPDGMTYDNQGQSVQCNSQEFYVNGMAGNYGVCAVSESLFGEQNTMVFYAPIFYDDEVIGVISGSYSEEQLSGFLETYMFKVSTSTYLCRPDGTIIGSSSPMSATESNALNLYAPGSLKDITFDELEQKFASEESVGFTYEGASGIGTAYLMKLTSYDWLILRTFPSSITSSMIERATQAGLILVMGMVVAAALFVVVLIIQARRQKDQLLLERQQATRIIDASTNLFAGLVSVNLNENTYQFLKAGSSLAGIEPAGNFDNLRTYWESTSASQGRSLIKEATERSYLNKNFLPDVPFLQFEYKALSQGKESWFQVSILCVHRNDAGHPDALLIAIQDVTQAKEEEMKSHQALEDAYRAAENASKAKSDFLNSMSHDIRTPMNSIMGFTAIASMYIDDKERVKESLANISSASKHLLGLINEVLDMAKIESGTIGLAEEEFDLPQVIDSLLSIINPQVNAKNLELKVDQSDIKHENVIGDSTRLQQVFVNIMGNSIKFTPAGGSISLHIRELPSRIADCGCYEFTFTDTGCGMSEEFIEKVFDPFTRENDSRVTKIEGTGLGMSIVKSVVSLMNGTIDVQSKLGEGTTFVVTVHLKLRDPGKEDLEALAGIRVLVVDDDLVACEGATIMLDDIGMRPDYRLSGAEGIDAVETATEEDDPYRAVILDWQMPGMSGIEAAKKIREVTGNNVPIIIFSGYDWSMVEQEARAVGVDAFISKPLFRSRLIQVMKELIVGKREELADPMEALKSCQLEGSRVLLVEDNVMAATLAQELIELTGATVDHAENGVIAVEMVQEHPASTYDLILMDIQMPEMNGYQATEAIRALGKTTRPDLAEIPIIALSADAFTEDVKHAKAVGMNDHMSKPLEIDRLVKIFGQWIPKNSK